MNIFFKTSSLLLFLVACAATKENTKDKLPETFERVVGTVVAKSGDCPLIIEIVTEKDTAQFVPSNLDPRYQKANMRLRFDYSIIAKKSNVTCKLPLIEMREVSPLR